MDRAALIGMAPDSAPRYIGPGTALRHGDARGFHSDLQETNTAP
jgi:hypothetical protein